MKKRFLLSAMLIPVLLLGAIGAWMIWYASHPLDVSGERAEVTVARGATMRQAAGQFSAAGVEVSPLVLYWLARLGGQADHIKAGRYAIESGITPRGIIDKLVRGDVILSEIAFIEGWTFAQMRAALDAHPELNHDSKGMEDSALLMLVGATETHPEGLFFPDTYRFNNGSSDLDVLRQAYTQMQTRLSDAWARRAPDSPLESPYEALILASIVEKETGRVEDRPLVASVFVNRLRSGMLLQTDPTVIYGMGERFDGNLRRVDLKSDTPYNTYTRRGLPPTPIAMPGMASIEAALNPPPSDYLYFVARGDGSSHFSRDLAEHNKAVKRFQLGQNG